MKNILAVALVLVFAFGATAIAGDGYVAKSTLSSMGFGSMRTISDAQGMEVRGMGAALAFSISQTAVLGASDTSLAAGAELGGNAYAAAASTSFSSNSLGASASSGGAAFAFGSP